MQKWERFFLLAGVATILVLQIVIVSLLIKPAPATTPPVTLFGPSSHPRATTPAVHAKADIPVVELPAPQSEGAAVMRHYCAQCHALPSPQQHNTSEWVELLNKKRSLLNRPRSGGFLGGGSVRAPSEQEWLSLQTYLNKHARK